MLGLDQLRCRGRADLPGVVPGGRGGDPPRRPARFIRSLRRVPGQRAHHRPGAAHRVLARVGARARQHGQVGTGLAAGAGRRHGKSPARTPGDLAAPVRRSGAIPPGLRAHGGDGHLHVVCARWQQARSPGAAAHRQTPGQHRGLPAGPSRPAGAGGPAGGDVHRRGGRGARLPAPGRPDPGALPAEPVPARRADVPHRRRRALASRWSAGVHGSAGPADQAARPPHRAWRDRKRAVQPSRGRPGRRHRARGSPGDPAFGGLRGGQADIGRAGQRSRARGPGSTFDDGAVRAAAAPLHGARGDRTARLVAPDGQRQGGPAGAAGPRRGGARATAERAPGRPRGAARGHLVPAPGRHQHRHRPGLLRRRRAFADGRAGPGRHQHPLRGEAVAAGFCSRRRPSPS